MELPGFLHVQVLSVRMDVLMCWLYGLTALVADIFVNLLFRAIIGDSNLLFRDFGVIIRLRLDILSSKEVIKC